MGDVNVELADEEQILAELQGKVFDQRKFIYPTQGGGYQITYMGVNWACREFAAKGEAIEISDVAKIMYDQQNPEYILVQVLARRVKIDPKSGTRIVLDSSIGSKRKWTKEKLKSGEIRSDPFFFEKAISQAQSSAKRNLLPQDFLLAFIKRVLSGTGGKAAPASSPSKGASGGSKKGAQQTTKAAETKPSGKGDLSALRQQFWAVLKRASGQKEDAKAREVLVALVGKDKVSNLTEDDLKKLGSVLRKVADGECSMAPDAKGTVAIKHLPSGDFIWPEGYKSPAEEAAAPSGASPEGSAPGGGDWMF